MLPWLIMRLGGIMKRRVLISLLIIGFSLPTIASSQATIKVGTACKVAGQIDAQLTLTQRGFFFFFACTKVNSKLVWKQTKYSESSFAKLSAKLIAQRAAVVYPGQGKKCVPGDCAIGSIGPAGGIVFYDAGSLKSWGRYLEVAPAGWTGRPEGNDTLTTWCDPMQEGAAIDFAKDINSDPKILPFTGATFGQGKSLTAKLLAKCPNGAALPVTNYVGGNTADWYLPSADELNALCKFTYGVLNTTPDMICDSTGNPRGEFQDDQYWSSSQGFSYGKPMPAAFVAWFGATKTFPAYSNYEPIQNTRAVRPIRAFGSPSDKLVDAGVIQNAGGGDSSWQSKCPIVMDRQKSTQPQVTAIHFNNDGGTFYRLKDNSSSAVTTSSNLIGCYADLDALKSGGGFQNIGSINRDAAGYFWQNGGGDTVGGRIRLTLNGSVLTATTGDPETISLIQ